MTSNKKSHPEGVATTGGEEERPMGVKVKQEKYLVRCLRTQRTETVYVNFIMTENGWFPHQCNGCEEMNASDKCAICAAFVTSKLFRDPDFQGKIYPKLE